jgi:hypothetical protein
MAHDFGIHILILPYPLPRATSNCSFSFQNFLFILFKFILQKYTTVSKFISFDHQPPWCTAAAMGHVVWRTNRRGPRRLGQRPRAQRVGRPTAVAHGDWSLTAVRHGGRTKRREPMAIAVLQMTCATAAGSLRLKTALKIIEINRKNYF